MTIQTISVEMIDPNPYQPKTRIDFRPEDLADLESIKAVGILQTPATRPHPEQPGRYQMIFGWRRRCAWQLYRPGEPIAVEVRQASNREMFEHGAIENGQRRDLGAIEKAQMMQAYIEQFGATQAQVGALFGMGQASVSNLIRLTKLPNTARELVDRGEVPERLARELVQFAQAGLGDVADQIAREIAKADPDQKEKTSSNEIDACLRKQSRLEDWPSNWIAEGQKIESPTCIKCTYYLSESYVLDGKRITRDFCAHKKKDCINARRGQWSQHELERISKETGISIIQPGEDVPILKFERWNDDDRLSDMIKKKRAPKCLRLKLKPDKFDAYAGSLHRRALGSDYLVICSTDKDVLHKKADEIKRETKATETPAQRKKREAKEESERTANRVERATQRKDKADILWMIFYAADTLSPQLSATGAPLELLDRLNRRDTQNPSGGEWHEYFNQLDQLVKRISNAQDGVKDALLRKHIIVRRIANRVSAFNPKEQYNIARAKKRLLEAVAELGLDLPAGWDAVPIHKTPTNCHVCGKFSSMDDRITKLELEQGWKDEGGIVTCSDKCRRGAAKPASAKR